MGQLNLLESSLAHAKPGGVAFQCRQERLGRPTLVMAVKAL
jgi:hypothetical protein